MASAVATANAHSAIRFLEKDDGRDQTPSVERLERQQVEGVDDREHPDRVMRRFFLAETREREDQGEYQPGDVEIAIAAEPHGKEMTGLVKEQDGDERDQLEPGVATGADDQESGEQNQR